MKIPARLDSPGNTPSTSPFDPARQFPDCREALTLTLFLAMAAACVTSAACVASTCVTSASYMAAPRPHLVSAEMIERLVSPGRMWTNVTVMWIEAVINVAMEVAWAVEPGTGSDEHAAIEPLGPVVPVWGAVVWGNVVVAVRADRRCSDIDGDLSGCRARNAQQSGSQGRKGKVFPIAHKFLLTLEKGNPDAKVGMTGRD